MGAPGADASFTCRNDSMMLPTNKNTAGPSNFTVPLPAAKVSNGNVSKRTQAGALTLTLSTKNNTRSEVISPGSSQRPPADASGDEIQPFVQKTKA